MSQTPKFARCSSSGFKESLYECQCPWPDDIFVQCGGSGVVLSKQGNYKTAFFEAFPNNPSTFIRGEGETIEKAEANCFSKYEKIMKCDGHVYKRLHAEHGVCEKCGLFTSYCFPPEAKCSVCGKEHVNFSLDKEPLCFKHYLEAVNNITPDKIANATSYMEKSTLKYALKHKGEYDVVLENNLLDLSVDYKIQRYMDELSKGFIKFEVSLSGKVADLMEGKIPTLGFLRASTASDKVLEQNPELFKNIFRWYLNDKGLIHFDMSREEIVREFMEKTLDMLKNWDEQKSSIDDDE
jgi:hypothetical protein